MEKLEDILTAAFWSLDKCLLQMIISQFCRSMNIVVVLRNPLQLRIPPRAVRVSSPSINFLCIEAHFFCFYRDINIKSVDFSKNFSYYGNIKISV